MIPIVTPAQMNQADADVAAPASTDTVSTAQLIQRAGAAVAFEARRLMGGTYGKRVLVVSGPGNNGADGATAAQLLESWGARCDVLPPAAVSTAGPAAGTATSTASEWLSSNDCGECFDLVIDAAFGTGLRSAWNPTPQPSAPVLAVDVPSGIDTLSGYDYGSWSAEVTLTFAALKPGLLLHPGAAKVGELKVVDLGTELAEAASSLASAQLLTDSDADAALVPTATNAHKWQTAVRVVAGSQKYSGAGYLTCAAALQAGAGMVALSVPGSAACDIQRPVEVVAVSTGGDWVKDVLGDIERYALLVIGPGIGTDSPVLQDSVLRDTAELIERCPVPVVIDADALTAVAEQPSCVQNRQAVTVLTPHEGEFARLVAGLASTGLASTGLASAGLVSTGPDIKQDRFQAVRSAAEMFQSIVLLKGPTTLVALPAQTEQAQTEPTQPVPAQAVSDQAVPAQSEKPSTVYAVTAGTQQLATAGSGDVLAGVIAGALACASTSAAAPIVAAAAHWHGRTTAASSHHHTPLPATQQIALLPAARSHIASSHIDAKTNSNQQ